MSKLYLPQEIEGNQVFSVKQYAEGRDLTRQAIYFHIGRYLERSKEKDRNSIRNLEVYIEERNERVYVHNLHLNRREGWCITFNPISGDLRKEIKDEKWGKRGPDKVPRRFNRRCILNLPQSRQSSLRKDNVDG